MYKIVVSIILGLLGFFLNFYPLHFYIPPYKASLVLGLVFPMLISLSWGWKYALIALIPGLGGQTMWFLWVPINGWAPFVAIPVYNLWIVWHGWCAQRKHRIFANIYSAEICFRIFNTIILYTLFRWVWQFNPSPWAPNLTLTSAPMAFVNFIAFKQVAEGLIILLAAHVLLNLNVFQKILLIDTKSKVKTGYIISAFLLFGGVFWFIAGFSDYLYHTDKLEFLRSHPHLTLAQTLILQVPGYQLITRFLFILTCLIAGLLVTKYALKFEKSEDTLRKSEAHLRTLIDTLPDLVWLKDPEGVYLACNQKFERFFGATEKEIVGKTDHDFVDKDLADFFRQKDKEAMVAGRPSMNEEEITFADDGHKEYLETIKTPMLDYNGQLRGVLGVGRDISERKEAEKALAEEKERLSVTLRSIGDGVIVTDTEGTIVFINKVAEKLTGWSNDDAKGKPSYEVFNIVNEKTGQKCASPISRVLELGRIVGLANHTALIKKDGHQISIADSGAPIRDKKSKIIGVVIVFRDITHEKKVEEELIRARKLESIGVLAGGIAHDFNNILSAIQGNIELASHRVGIDAETRSLLLEAQKATKRATRLTQQLLTFSKGGDPVKETASFSRLIPEAAEFVLHGSQVSCEYTFQEGLWLGNIDSGQISQVIQNLVLNAKHAMSGGGTIRIRCDNVVDPASESLLSMHDGNYVRIAIEDTGIGIPKEILDNIFDPYFSTKQEGSGLGLAICHSIINKHDGIITVQSKPGKGTTFILYLPAEPSSEMPEENKFTSKSAVKSAKVMLMDDEEMIRDIAQKQLLILGHEAVLVADGEQAINKYQELQDSGVPVDLVIMDLTIPGGMGGKDAAQRLLQLDPGAKIIVASGYSNDPIMANYREYGFCAALAKPFDLDELRKGVESALSLK